MRIGIDCDNTIVCYDGVFHRLAVQRGLIGGGVELSKTAVRDALRAAGREADWTALQGEVYGPRILEAEPFPGVIVFLRRAADTGADLHLVSHKTRRPYAGAAHDLHAAAMRWLSHHRLIDGANAVFSKANLHFLPTRQGKLQCINRLRCDLFIDDLPDLLLDAAFPAGVQRILFDPQDRHADLPTMQRIGAWPEALRLIEPAGAAR